MQEKSAQHGRHDAARDGLRQTQASDVLVARAMREGSHDGCLNFTETVSFSARARARAAATAAALMRRYCTVKCWCRRCAARRSTAVRRHPQRDTGVASAAVSGRVQRTTVELSARRGGGAVRRVRGGHAATWGCKCARGRRDSGAAFVRLTCAVCLEVRRIREFGALAGALAWAGWSRERAPSRKHAAPRARDSCGTRPATHHNFTPSSRL